MPPKKLPILSASQIKTFARCKRKWGWEYIAGHRPPPGPSAELGIRVHSILEAYLKDGVMPRSDTKEGQIAAAGLSLLPPRDVGWLAVERRIDFSHGDPPIAYRGFIDCLYTPSDEAVAQIIDHKTTTDFKYGLTEEELKQDIQSIMYARWYFGMDEMAEVVDLQWIYYHTRQFRSKVVEATLDRSQVFEAFEKIHNAYSLPIAEALISIVDPKELEPNYDACGDYGGCPHAQRCELKPNDLFVSAFKDDQQKQELKERNMSTLADKMKSKMGSAPAAKPAESAPKANGIAREPKIERPTASILPPEAPSESEALDPTPIALDAKEAKKSLSLDRQVFAQIYQAAFATVKDIASADSTSAQNVFPHVLDLARSAWADYRDEFLRKGGK